VPCSPPLSASIEKKRRRRLRKKGEYLTGKKGRGFHHDAPPPRVQKLAKRTKYLPPVVVVKSPTEFLYLSAQLTALKAHCWPRRPNRIELMPAAIKFSTQTSMEASHRPIVETVQWIALIGRDSGNGNCIYPFSGDPWQ
jgi:hypothetical protein